MLTVHFVQFIAKNLRNNANTRTYRVPIMGEGGGPTCICTRQTSRFLFFFGKWTTVQQTAHKSLQPIPYQIPSC